MNPNFRPALELLDRLIATTPEERLPALVVALLAKAGELAGRHLMATATADRGGQQPEENLSVAEAARRLGVSRDWLYRHSAKLPFTVRIGRRLVFSARGLERWNGQRQGRDRA